jgi:hypothetical protein
MKINSSHLVGAAIALAAVFLSKLDAQNSQTARDAVPRWSAEMEVPRWEYKLMSSKTLGQDFVSDYWNGPNYGYAGWDLVTVVWDPRQNEFEAVFKRPKGWDD